MTTKETVTEVAVDRKETPFFSVVIPVYNSEKYLLDCLDSVAKQTFRDFEVILMDDCSTDSSGRICDDFANKDMRFSAFHNEKNLKILLNRTGGIKKAKGNFVVCLDNDDILRQDCLETIHSAIIEMNADLVLYSWSRSESFSTNEGELPFEEGKILDKKSLYELFCSTTKINPTWRKVFKREFLDNVDFMEYKDVLNSEDRVISCYIFSGTQRPYYINKPMYYWRPTPTSVTHTYNPNLWNTQKGASKCLLKFSRGWDSELSLDHELETLSTNLAYEAFFSVVINYLIGAPTKQSAANELKKIRKDDFFLEIYRTHLNIKPRTRSKIILSLLKNNLFLPLYLLRLFAIRKRSK